MNTLLSICEMMYVEYIRQVKLSQLCEFNTDSDV